MSAKTRYDAARTKFDQMQFNLLTGAEMADIFGDTLFVDPYYAPIGDTSMGVNFCKFDPKVHTLILRNHGLLATAAYSFTEKEGWQKAFDAVARHLADPDIAIVPNHCNDRAKLMEFLTDKTTTSETLKLATAETMAWLTYATRFVKKG